MNREDVTPEYVRSVLAYDAQTGVFTRTWSRDTRRIGELAGVAHKGHGYVVIKIRQHAFLAHRLAWAHYYGEWPSDDVDHINLDRRDNRISNLRIGTKRQNTMNWPIKRTSKSGIKGVTYRAELGKWVATIGVYGKVQHLGVFTSPDAASLAYQRAAVEYFGEYARFDGAAYENNRDDWMASRDAHNAGRPPLARKQRLTKKTHNLTAEHLRGRYSYDPETGLFTNLAKGTPVGYYTPKGYTEIRIDGVAYSVHRLAWLYMTGKHPADLVDHINGQRDDNRWANLRAVTASQNVWNSRTRANKTGFRGVTYDPGRSRPWRAQIMLNDRTVRIGDFSSPREASAAYEETARKHRGQYARY